MSHTPGPWSVNDEFRHADNRIAFHLIQVDTTENWKPIASTWGGPNEANASLIAAAPDLLAIVETMLAVREFVDTNDILGEQSSLIADARAALAKAKGEA